MQQQQQVAPAGLMEQFGAYLARDYLALRRINVWHHEAHDRVAISLDALAQSYSLRDIWLALGLGDTRPQDVTLEALISVERAGREWTVELQMLTRSPLADAEDVDMDGVLIDDDEEETQEQESENKNGWYDQLIGSVQSSNGRIYVYGVSDRLTILAPIMGWFYQRVKEAL